MFFKQLKIIFSLKKFMESSHKKAISSIYSTTELGPNIIKDEKINKTYNFKSKESLKQCKFDSFKKSKDKSISKFNYESEMLKNLNILYEYHNSSLDQNDRNYNNNKISLEIQEKKLNKNIYKLKINIIIQLLINIIDFLLMTLFQKIFFNFFNIFVLFLILIFDFFIYKEFVQGFEEINRNYYKNIKKILYFTIIIMIIFFSDMIYEIVVQILIINLPNYETPCIIKWLFFILFYSFINISSPIFLIKYLVEIKNNIKYFGALEGKDYSLPSNKIHNFSKSES